MEMMNAMDKARQNTDKQLKIMERAVGRVYKTNPALIKIQKEYADYMDMVEKRTKSDFKAFKNENDIDNRQKLKEVYMAKIRTLTVESTQYQDIVKRFTEIMAQVNQDALDIVNANMPSIYAVNYNQVAGDCRKAGIKVNGKK